LPAVAAELAPKYSIPVTVFLQKASARVLAGLPAERWFMRESQGVVRNFAPDSLRFNSEEFTGT
jgi:hypothetical protein